MGVMQPLNQTTRLFHGKYESCLITEPGDGEVDTSANKAYRGWIVAAAATYSHILHLFDIYTYIYVYIMVNIVKVIHV